MPGEEAPIASILARTVIKDEEGSLDGELLRELGKDFEAINRLLKVLAEASQRATAADICEEAELDRSHIIADPLASLTFSEAREMQMLDSKLLTMLEVAADHRSLKLSLSNRSSTFCTPSQFLRSALFSCK